MNTNYIINNVNPMLTGSAPKTAPSPKQISEIDIFILSNKLCPDRLNLSGLDKYNENKTDYKLLRGDVNA